jgi:hypothetical protein
MTIFHFVTFYLVVMQIDRVLLVIFVKLGVQFQLSEFKPN